MNIPVIITLNYLLSLKTPVSVDALLTIKQLSYSILSESLVQTLAFALAEAVAEALVHTLPQTLEDAKVKTLQDTQDDV